MKSEFDVSNAVLAIHPGWLWGIFVVVGIVAAVFTMILFYHWRMLDTEMVRHGRLAYLIGLSILFTISIISTIFFHLYV